MSTALPPPVPLPDPPGSPGALAGVLDQLTSAGFAAGLTVHLLEPAAAVPGWQGADADAATAQVVAAGGVAADLHGALTAASGRLADHAELWSAVLARVASLRAAQRHQFADAAVRLATLLAGAPDAGPGGSPPPAAVALVREVAADDAARRAQHAALLDDLAEDATSAAALLGRLSAPFGGTARPGDVDRVTVRLAGVLPGWGDGALTTLAREAATALTAPGTAAELDTTAQRWTTCAAAPAFADALLDDLGTDGVRWLLTALGGRSVETERGPLAGLLAAAAAAGTTGGRGAEVLAAVRLDPADPDGAVDGVGIGMGMVLAALTAGGRAADGAVLAAGWARQLLDREAAQGATAVERTTATLPDPVAAAVAVLAAAGDPAAAAAALGDAGSWTRLLARAWPAGTDDLTAVVGLAARAPGAPQVAGAALQALGQGLRPGTSELVMVDDATLRAVGGRLAELVAGQLDVVLPVLDAVAGSAAGAVDDATDTALRGLGHLLADDDRVRTVGAAVRGALAAGPGGPAAGRLAGGYVAVEEYGQRIGYLLDFAREQELAVDRQAFWMLAVDLPTELVTRVSTGPASVVVQPVVDEVVGWLQSTAGFDGTVDIGPDTGATYGSWDARRWAGAALGGLAGGPGGAAPGALDPGGAGTGAGDTGGAAEAGFARVADLLGRPVPPAPSLLDEVQDLQDDVPDRPERDEAHDRPHIGRR